MFDARVMKMHYCHPPQMHTNVFGSWAPPGPSGELKCSPDSLATTGKGMGKRGERKGNGRVQNYNFKKQQFYAKRKRARQKLHIIQTAKAVGLTMAYRKKGSQRSLAWGPPRA